MSMSIIILQKLYNVICHICARNYKVIECIKTKEIYKLHV